MSTKQNIVIQGNEFENALYMIITKIWEISSVVQYVKSSKIYQWDGWAIILCICVLKYFPNVFRIVDGNYF